MDSPHLSERVFILLGSQNSGLAWHDPQKRRCFMGIVAFHICSGLLVLLAWYVFNDYITFTHNPYFGRGEKDGGG